MTDDHREPLFDEDAGPLVRPYAVTRGRTGTGEHRLDMITLVIAIRSEADLDTAAPEYGAIVRYCRRPKSIAEVAAAVAQPLSVTKILVGDLIDADYLIFRSPVLSSSTGPDTDINLLRTVLDGIRKL
jgi:hypothetical protein